MTARELILARPLGLSEAELLVFIADNLTEARLRNGCVLCDAIDFREWLLELSVASKIESQVLASPNKLLPCRVPAQPRYPIARVGSDPCPRCGHVHQGDRECGEQLGGGRICRCEMEVPA